MKNAETEAMKTDPWVSRSWEEPYLELSCDCGWSGTDADINDWDIQKESDRAVRVCPGCENPVPEWGALRPLDGAAQIAKGSLEEALIEADLIED